MEDVCGGDTLVDVILVPAPTALEATGGLAGHLVPPPLDTFLLQTGIRDKTEIASTALDGSRILEHVSRHSMPANRYH